MLQYAIYGINRVEKDFRYIFDEIEVTCYFEDNNQISLYCGLPVYFIEEFWSCKRTFDKVIVCGFDKDKKIEKLEKMGLIYESDFYLEEDFFETLDDYQISKVVMGRKIVLWGTGRIAKRFLTECPRIKVDCFLDSDTTKSIFYGKKVYHPEEIRDWKSFFIIVAMKNNLEVIDFLKKHGVEELDYIGYEKLLYAPSSLLHKTIFDQSYYELTCNTMKNHFEVDDAGDCAYCCAAFQNINAGNLLTSEFKNIWNGNLHRVMCLSAENHTYSFCDKTMCPMFFRKGKKSIPISLQSRKYKKMDYMPKALLVAIDKSCNLNCITCRKDIYIAKGKVKETSMKLAEIIIQFILPGIHFLILAGNGEVFLSEAYRKIYLSKACAEVGHVRLLTNGLLLTKKNWDSFYANNRHNEIILSVSIDAAKKKTYEKIRRNGNFEMIKNNMELASELRREGKLSYLRMNFVVQRENYTEMPDFVDWAVQIGADEVFFTKILNWGTYTEQEFKNISMMEEDQVTAKAELREILNNPLMKSKIVELGTINYERCDGDIDYVDNYYEWELVKRNKGLF